MLEDYDEALVSQAYTVFEVIDTEELDPEYLMMWFRRPEFDRYARFKSHGSVREIFDWEEMCEVSLPVPSIEKQRAVVKEYNTVVNRIKLNEQLNQKLEETAQALYKHWFVDFEFPNQDGKPYISSGGKMVYNAELEKEIPEGWEVKDLDFFIDFGNGKSRPIMEGQYPVYGGNGIIDFVNTFNQSNVIAIGRVGAYCGSLYRVIAKCWISDNAIYAKSKINSLMFTYYVLKELDLNARSEGTGQPLITQGLLKSIKYAFPNIDLIGEFEKQIQILFKAQTKLKLERDCLNKLNSFLLSKMTQIESVKEVVV